MEIDLHPPGQPLTTGLPVTLEPVRPLLPSEAGCTHDLRIVRGQRILIADYDRGAWHVEVSGRLRLEDLLLEGYVYLGEVKEDGQLVSMPLAEVAIRPGRPSLGAEPVAEGAAP